MTYQATSQPTVFRCIEDGVDFDINPASDGVTMHPYALDFLAQQQAGTLVLVPAPDRVEVYRQSLLSMLAHRRWQQETGGTTVAGLSLATDDRTKLLLQGAAQAAQSNPAFTTRWKTPTGWIQLDAAAISACYSAVFAHVENCFARESELAAQIDACTTIEQLSTIEAAIAVFWP